MSTRENRLAWAAGFFDGEGYVTIQIRGGKYKGHYLRIGINHVDPSPLVEMQELFGGNIRKQNPEKVIGNRHQRSEWGISCKKAEAALREMLPYFLNKGEVASLGIMLQETMGTGEVGPETLKLRERIKQSIQELNAAD